MRMHCILHESANWKDDIDCKVAQVKRIFSSLKVLIKSEIKNQRNPGPNLRDHFVT